MGNARVIANKVNVIVSETRCVVTYNGFAAYKNISVIINIYAASYTGSFIFRNVNIVQNAVIIVTASIPIDTCTVYSLVACDVTIICSDFAVFT